MKVLNDAQLKRMKPPCLRTLRSMIRELQCCNPHGQYTGSPFFGLWLQMAKKTGYHPNYLSQYMGYLSPFAKLKHSHHLCGRICQIPLGPSALFHVGITFERLFQSCFVSLRQVGSMVETTHALDRMTKPWIS